MFALTDEPRDIGDGYRWMPIYATAVRRDGAAQAGQPGASFISVAHVAAQ
jgi:hypothetical protein